MRYAELLREYTTTRKQFNQILNDESVRMGFECEMSSPYNNNDDDEEPLDTRLKIARNLGAELNVRCINGRAERGDLNTWQVISDISIVGSGVGAEVVSGVYSVKNGLEKLKQCFDWMKRHNMETNKTTGLHVSFSIEGITSDEDYDFLKMMLMFDENYTANMFDRIDNVDFAQQMRQILYHDMEHKDLADIMASRRIGSIVKSLKAIGKNLPSQLGHQKYYSFRHRANGVIEFRNMGGEDYQNMFSLIRSRIVNMAYVLKLGSDDSLLQQEYLKKAWAILTSEKFSDPSLEKREKPKEIVPAMLNSFTRIIHRSSELMHDLRFGSMQDLLRDLLYTIEVPRLSRIQIRQLRYALRANKMNAVRVRGLLRTDVKYNHLANVMGWPLVVPGEHPDEQEPLPFAQRGTDLSGHFAEPEPEDFNRNRWNERNQIALPHHAQSITRGLHQNARTTRWGRTRTTPQDNT